MMQRHISRVSAGILQISGFSRRIRRPPMRRMKVMSRQIVHATGGVSVDSVVDGKDGKNVVSRKAPPAAKGYKLPPQNILDIVDQPKEPLYSFSPDRRMVLEITRPPAHPSVIEYAKPELKLAGVRIDPQGFTRSKLNHYTGLALTNVSSELHLPLSEDKKRRIVGLPQGYGIRDVSWASDGNHIAFTVRKIGQGVTDVCPPSSLWVADVKTCEAKCVLENLNTVFIQYSWIGNDTLIAGVVPEETRPAPDDEEKSFGPRIEENDGGKKSQTRTYQDLLKNQYDEEMFSYYCTSKLFSVDVKTGVKSVFSDESRVYTSLSPSPSGEYLLVSWLEKPWSYAVPCGRFPKVVQLLDKRGNHIREIARLPLALDIPLAFDSCREGPRGITWRDDKPHVVIWAECQDGGDPNMEAVPRDIVYSLDAEAGHAAPTPIAETNFRYAGIVWGDDSLALLYESEWKTRRSRTWILAPDGSRKPELLFDLNYEDSYNDPGSPILRRIPNGSYVLAEIDKKRQLLLQGMRFSTMIPVLSRMHSDASFG